MTRRAVLVVATLGIAAPLAFEFFSRVLGIGTSYHHAR